MPMILIALLAAPVHAARLTVDPGGSGDYLDLSSALADVQDGDYIALEPGEYVGGTQITTAVRIVGLGESPLDTRLSGSSLGLDLRAQAWLDNLTLSGTSYGLYAYGVNAQARRVVLQGANPLYAYLSTVEMENVAFYDGPVRLQSSALSGSQFSFVDSSLYVSSSGYPVELSGVVGNAFTVTCSSSSPSVQLSYVLYDAGSLDSCVVPTAIYAGFDTGWTSYTGEPATGDLTLLSGSLGVDAGDPSCVDVDGSRCDLGHLGGLLGLDVDLDGDAIPDAYEDSVGLDSSLANGADDDDGDGLDNLGEYLFGTDALNVDSDGDGAGDQEELELGFDPLDPSDQGPSAFLTAPDFGVVDTPVVLDSSLSSDPTNDTLAYTITVVAAPSASLLLGSELSMSGALGAFTPDAVGLWSFELLVSDGVSTDSVQLEWRVRDVGTEIRVPEDFASLDDAAAVFKARDSIHIAPGDYTLVAAAVDSYRGLRFVGSGMDETRILLSGELKVQDLEAQDLELVGEGYYAMRVQGGEHLELSGVRISGSVYGFTASDLDWISIEGSALTGDDYAAILQSIGSTAVVRSSVSGTLSLGYGERLRMHGVWFDGSMATADGLVLSSVYDVELSNISMTSLRHAFTGSNLSKVRADHIYMQDITGELCIAGEWRHVMIRGATSALSGCDVLGVTSDGAGLDGSGVPLQSSLAWDGGDPFSYEADGTTQDVGWTGGHHGMRQDPELEQIWEDADGDGLSTLSEWTYGSDPSLADSDGDGVGDRVEIMLGRDPADPSDHVAVLSPRPLRLQGQSESVSYSVVDPQGGSCEMVWQDGLEGSSREIPAEGPSSEVLGFEITCGHGRSSGELLVLREVEVSVPGDFPNLLEALQAAEDHHRILLGEGVWEVGALSLEGSEVAISGQGDTWISGELNIDGQATSLVDLGVIGDLQTRAGGLVRVEVQGDVTSSKTWMRNVLVHGDLHAGGGSAANLSVVGELVGGFSDIRSSASGGAFQVRESALASYNLQNAAELLWIHPSELPDDAVLLPWPGSPLWDSGSQQESLLDLDGSREDVGWTGGPEARDFDLDSDGLPDPYERWAGVSEPDEDEDEDGWDNAEEFAQGTDPLNWDTDGDRLMDSVDPQPLVASGDGLSLTLRASDAFPKQGEWVQVRADLRDPAGLLAEVEWSVLSPPGSQERIEIDGDTVTLNIDAVGAWQLQAQLEVEGEPVSAEMILYTQDPVLVPLNTSLERAIDEARPGQVLLIEGGPREVSGLVVTKDLVIRHEAGAAGVLNSDLLAPMLEVSDGARVRLEGITLRAGTELPAVLVTKGGILEMRQASIIGGLHNIAATNASVDLQGSLLSLPDNAALLGVDSSFYLAHTNLGWSNDFEDPGLLFDLSGSSVALMASVPQWEGVSWTLCRRLPCTVLAESSVLPDEELLFLDNYLQAQGSFFGEPGFIEAPSEDLNPAGADLRLKSSAPIHDVLDSLDWDGSAGDVGMYGGPWGDWLNVDNDRDGYTNLDGDCDDGDPDVVPNLLTGECELRGGCASQGRGSAPLPLLLGLLALLWRLSRASPKAAGATGREID